MVCPFCFHTKTTVYNSRGGDKLNITWRRRRCPKCSAQFTTYESTDPGAILTVKNGSTITPFSHTKMFIELLQVCAHRTDLNSSIPYLAATIEQKLYRLAADKKFISKTLILETTLQTLKNYDPVAYVSYLGRHQKHLTPQQIRAALKRKK